MHEATARQLSSKKVNRQNGEKMTIGYRSVHNTSTMSSNGLCNMMNVDGVEMLLIEGSLHKYLSVHIIIITRYKYVNVTHYF
jgi:ethanolamine utilization protein EutQ (cupin superfamily)